MNLPYWEYFLSIESDLEKCTKYISFSENNYNAYSVEFAKIIMTASAEIDNIAKELCREINPQSSPRNINDYKNIILEHYQNFHTLEIEIVRYDLKFKPWEDWNTQTPSWWRDYNDIKHNRTQNFEKANLGNALKSVSALLTIILYYYDKKFGRQNINIDAFFAPRLFSPIEPTTNNFQNGGIYWSYTLP